MTYLAEGVPAYHLTNTCGQGRYRIEKDIVADPRPRRGAAADRASIALQGSLEDYHLYVLLAPHSRQPRRGQHRLGRRLQGRAHALRRARRQRPGAGLLRALAASARSASSGVSDGWQDLVRHRRMTWDYDRAENGNVALTRRDRPGGVRRRVSAGPGLRQQLRGGRSPRPGQPLRRLRGSARPATSSELAAPGSGGSTSSTCRMRAGAAQSVRISTAVLRAHESRRFPAASSPASPSPGASPRAMTTWAATIWSGRAIWSRSAGGLLAAAARDDVRRVLHYLQVTQEADGHWPQNMWLDGTPYWQRHPDGRDGLPHPAGRPGAARGGARRGRSGPALAHGAQGRGFLVRNGPVTQQDRWEEDAGYSPFTLAAEIAALLVAADLAETNDEPGAAGVPPRDRRRLERNDRTLDLRHGHRPGAAHGR